MRATILGTRTLNFEAEQGTVKGTQLFIAFRENGVDGEMCDKLFIREDFLLPDLKPGDSVEISFNHRGRPEEVRLVPKKISINQ